jgi:hypothetical protein
MHIVHLLLLRKLEPNGANLGLQAAYAISTDPGSHLRNWLALCGGRSSSSLAIPSGFAIVLWIMGIGSFGLTESCDRKPTAWWDT